MTTPRLLIVTAVEPEAQAVRAGLSASGIEPVTAASQVGRTGAAIFAVAAVGVGPAAAAAGTARLLALAEARGEPCTAVISTGIAGGFAGRAAVGGTVLGVRSLAADLGAETPTQDPSSHAFLPIEELGFGTSVIAADPDLLDAVTSALPEAIRGDILTLATVTGTAGTTARLEAQYPHAVAEAMEGFGVASAARALGLPFLELRAISNPIGPRDRASWRLQEAFGALTGGWQRAGKVLH
ncbi:futalosine hydrolase [Actinoplanes sp. TFC3]|uniref:futalosine hydrolase n=1 Tax=Actinoplanes sp. TFC3 TaxID=1710355 RepID=UPI0008317A73|nr:futalosine hydrolase [Actinoplanes sp. TFC3]